MFYRIIIVGAIFAFCDGSVFEDVAFEGYKQLLIANGESEIRADCVVGVLKYTGVTSDIVSFDMITNENRQLQKLVDKAQFADFVCSPAGIAVILLAFCLIFSFLCVCLKRCCSRKPMRVQIDSSKLRFNNVNVPYARTDFA